MINPDNLTEYGADEARLQEHILFGVVAAGKPAHRQAQLLERFLSLAEGDTPFERIRAMDRAGALEDKLWAVRIGQYRRIAGAFRHLAHSGLDLAICTVEQLEAVPGIGPKTARMFVLHTRPGQRVAVLDVHILRWLRSNGLRAPAQTPPPGRVYRQLERAFLALADDLGLSVAELDLGVWRSMRREAG